MPDFKESHEPIDYAGEVKKRFTELYEQFDDDESLWRLEQYQLEEISENAPQKRGDYPTITSNEPRNYLDVVVSALNRFPIRWRGEQLGGGEGVTGQESEISLHEQFATGLWREVDDLRLRRAEMPFQHDVAFLNALRGGTAIRPWILSRVPQTPFRAELWDLRDCAWEIGQNGVSFFAHHYAAAEHDIRQTWNYWKGKLDGDAEGNVEVYDCWWLDPKAEVWNAVLAPGAVELKEFTNHTEKDRLDHIPVNLTRADGAPIASRPGRKDHYYMTDQWQSIFAPNRGMYATYNRIASLYGLIIRSGAIGPYFGKLGQRQRPLSADEARKSLKPFAFIQGFDDVRAVAPPEIAESARELWQATIGHIQRGSVPHTIYGQTPFELTGIAISQLQGALDLKLVGQRNAMINAYRLATDDFIQMFVRSRRRKVTLSGIDRRDRPFVQPFSAADLRTKYWLVPELRIDLPITRQQEAQVAQMWQGLGVPLEIIFDQLIHLQDPQGAYERKLAEMADVEPAVQDMKRVFVLRDMAAKEEDPDRRELMGRMAEFFQARVAMVSGPAGGGGEAGGFSPEILSPEMAGQSEQHLQPFNRGPQHMPGSTSGRGRVAERLRAMGLEMAR